MKILFLGLNYSPEEIGIGLYSGDMCRALTKAGHEVRAVVAQPYYPTWKVFDGYAGTGWTRASEDGVDVTRCPIYVPAAPSGIKRIVHHLSFLASALPPLLHAAFTGKPDIVMTVAPSLIGAPAAWIAAKIARAPSWIHVQDFEMEAAMATGLVGKGGLASRIGPWIERTIISRFKYGSSISTQMCAKLIEKGMSPDRVYQLRNWADIDAVRPMQEPSRYRAEWGIQTPQVALYSGNIANKQGIDVVLAAARLLRHRSDLTFVICGQGPNRAHLEALAADLPNVRFYDLQPRERLGELLGMATIHLMPQLADAADLVLPSKLTNMLASGRPIVATANPGTGLAIEMEGCGLLTAPGSPESLARSITALIEAPEAAAAFGLAARRRAETHWSKEAILAQLSSRLESTIATTRAR